MGPRLRFGKDGQDGEGREPWREEQMAGPRSLKVRSSAFLSPSFPLFELCYSMSPPDLQTRLLRVQKTSSLSNRDVMATPMQGWGQFKREMVESRST